MNEAARILRTHPSAVLLAAQLVSVLAYPFFDEAATGRAVIGVVQMGVVLIALWAVRRTPALSWVAAVFGAPALVFTVLEAVHPGSDAVVLTSALLHAPFYFYVSYGMIRYLFHDDRVTRDELYATETPDGIKLTPFDPAFAGQMEVAEQVMRKRRTLLRKLAE